MGFSIGNSGVEPEQQQTSGGATTAPSSTTTNLQGTTALTPAGTQPQQQKGFSVGPKGDDPTADDTTTTTPTEEPVVEESTEDDDPKPTESKTYSAEDTIWNNILEIIFGGGGGGLAGAGEAHKPLTGGSVNVPDLTIPEIAWDKIKSIFSAFVQSIEYLGKVLKKGQRKFHIFLEHFINAITIGAIKTPYFDLAPGEELPDQAHAKRTFDKFQGNATDLNYYGVELIDGVYYKLGRAAFDRTVAEIGNILGIIIGLGKVKSILTLLKTALDPRNWISMFKRLKDLVKGWIKAGKITRPVGTVTKARAFSKAELDKAGKLLAKGKPWLPSSMRAVKDYAVKYGDEFIQYMNREAGKAAKQAYLKAQGQAKNIAFNSISIAAEYQAAKALVEEQVQNYIRQSGETFTQEEIDDITYWYAANWVSNRVIGLFIGKLRGTKTIPGNILDFLAADLLVYLSTAATGGGQNIGTLASVLTTIISQAIEAGLIPHSVATTISSALGIGGATGMARGGEVVEPKTAFYLKSGGKVGNKIKLLMSEGKPQKQAVAIALDYKRRGKL